MQYSELAEQYNSRQKQIKRTRKLATYRNRESMWLKILKTMMLEDVRTISGLTYKAQTNYRYTKSYLEDMITHGLVQSKTVTYILNGGIHKRGTHYLITDAGKRYYVIMQELLRLCPSKRQ